MTSITLTEDQIDDILFCARTNEHQDLVELLKELGGEDKEKIARILDQAKTDTGNTAWHYAAANAHLGE